MNASDFFFDLIWIFEIVDAEHPIVPVSIPLIQGNQFEDITIPCKPTSKQWEVQLFKENDEVIE